MTGAPVPSFPGLCASLLFKNSFTEVQFTQRTMHPLNAYSSVVLSLIGCVRPSARFTLGCCVTKKKKPFGSQPLTTRPSPGQLCAPSLGTRFAAAGHSSPREHTLRGQCLGPSSQGWGSAPAHAVPRGDVSVYTDVCWWMASGHPCCRRKCQARLWAAASLLPGGKPGAAQAVCPPGQGGHCGRAGITSAHQWGHDRQPSLLCGSAWTSRCGRANTPTLLVLPARRLCPLRLCPNQPSPTGQDPAP